MSETGKPVVTDPAEEKQDQPARVAPALRATWCGAGRE